ncbi:MAG: sporulation protein YabP [Bacillota bacterium]|jgi:sporulation protein YabP
MEDRDISNFDHQVTITNREHVVIKGVLNVESFDDQEVILETEMGALTLRGEDLQIRQLSLEEGDFAVEGMLNALQYLPGSRARAKGKKNFIDRLFR